ncbi:response regulator [Gaetbulibacter aestuarii]|uniref:Response regulator n=1 Tax=Gaetbulibacter aestuarii TaxID=1502358 RepID=A0ABW7MXZ2_9FLAO
MNIKDKNRCLLVVDDDNICNLVTKTLIRKTGFTGHIEIAKNGNDGLDYLSKSLSPNQKNLSPLPDLILLDINMPEINGWQFLDALDSFDQKIINDVSVVMVTSSVSPFDTKRAEDSKYVYEFVTKPLNEAKVKYLLDKYFCQNTKARTRKILR